MNEKMNDALSQIRDEYIHEAAKEQKRRPYWFGAVAAVLVIALLLGIHGDPGTVDPLDTQPFLGGNDPTTQGTLPGTEDSDPTSQPTQSTEPGGLTPPFDSGTLQLANLAASPQFPEMADYPNRNDFTDYTEYNAAYQAWSTDQKNQYAQPDGYADGLSDFFLTSIRQFLKTDENSAYSPLNVYMALAMMAEATGGNSRQQVLDLLGVDSMEALRLQASYVWNAHYSDDGATTLLLGSSLWLDEEYGFHQNTVNTLANNYYASVFHGDLGSDSMNEQLYAWLNANTGGLLQEQAAEEKMDPNTVFALAATVYFAAGWESAFSAKLTANGIFHTGEQNLMVPFMHQTYTGYTYYWGSNFAAVCLGLSGENDMWLILPDEGSTVADILESDDYLRLVMDPGSWENQGRYEIHLSLPKFDVVSSTDLIPGLINMGITDVLNPSISDFSSITDTPGLMLTGASHAARVVIDEEGCLAAAFTVMEYEDTALPPKYDRFDFILDRPFLFVVSSRDNLPLFVGTVVEP